MYSYIYVYPNKKGNDVAVLVGMGWNLPEFRAPAKPNPANCSLCDKSVFQYPLHGIRTCALCVPYYLSAKEH